MVVAQFERTELLFQLGDADAWRIIMNTSSTSASMAKFTQDGVDLFLLSVRSYLKKSNSYIRDVNVPEAVVQRDRVAHEVVMVTDCESILLDRPQGRKANECNLFPYS